MRLQIAWALTHFLWEGAAIAVLLWVLLQVLRDARVRYNACAAALALMCASPVATLLWLMPHALTLREPGGRILNTALPASSGSSVSWFEANAAWLLWLWLAGALGLLARAAAAWWRARRLVTRELAPMPGSVELAARRLALQLGAKRVQFRASARVASALVFGWLKPIVVLPAAALGRLSEAEIEALLAHELAHVIRCDFFVNLLQTMAECVLFYHPLVWWVSARMREERELCCDDIAVAVCRDEVLYSRALLRLEELRMEPALAATGGRLAHRIRRLLAGPESGSTSGLSAAPGLALVLMLGVSVALLAQNSPPEPPAPPPAPPPPAELVALRAPSVPPPPDGSARSQTVYRAGGDVSRPRLVYRVEPEYTKEAQAAHLEGSVALSIVVSPEGAPTDIKVVRSLDNGLDGKALEAVSRWKFEPGRKGGKPVPVIANIEINFHLIDDARVPAVPPSAVDRVIIPIPLVGPDETPLTVYRRYRPGGATSMPVPIYKVQPVYTEKARTAHLEGAALLSAVISPEGIAKDIKVRTSLDRGLDEMAVEAVRKWRFEPALKDGKPVPVKANIEMKFRLLDEPPVPAMAPVPPAPPVIPAPAAALRPRVSSVLRAAPAVLEVPEPIEPALAPEPPEPPEPPIEGNAVPAPPPPSAPPSGGVRRGVNGGVRGGVIAPTQADRAEMERRRRFVKERYVGENTDHGKVYMHYGPPDEIMSNPSRGKGTEIWRYKDPSKAKVLLEIEFEDGKQVRRSGGLAADH